MKDEKGRKGSFKLFIHQEGRGGGIDASYSTKATGACSKASRGIRHLVHSISFMDEDCLKLDDNLWLGNSYAILVLGILSVISHQSLIGSVV